MVMEKINFIYQDPSHSERRSDGLNFVIAPKISADKVCVYCNEYDSFSLSVSDFEKGVFVPAPKSMSFRSAKLEEICEQGLSGFIDLISAYDVENNRSKYIYLSVDVSPAASQKFGFFTLKEVDKNKSGIFCKIPEFFDEKIYFYSILEGCFWHRPEEFGLQGKAVKFKSHNIAPVSVLNIYGAGYLDLVGGVKNFLLTREGLVEGEAIYF